MSYKWTTDGIISWKDGNIGVEPELPLSSSGADWSGAYADFSGSWSLLGIINAIVAYVESIPTGRYWLAPVKDSTILAEPLAPTVGDRYIINGVASGTNWLGHDNCIAEFVAGSPDYWEFYEKGASPPLELVDGASTWDFTNDTYWVFNGTGASEEWIQCGGTTLEKIIRVTTGATYLINNTTHRGVTFIGDPVSGTTLFELPLCSEGLWYRIMKATAAGASLNVDIQVKDTDPACINVISKALVLDQAVPTVPSQQYRKIRMTEEYDYVDVLGTADGWTVVGGIGAIKDRSLTAKGTATAGGANTLTLEVADAATDKAYVGRLIVLTSGTCKGQIRKIIDYVANTRVATVTPAWTGGPPDNTSQYDMITYDAYLLSIGEIGTAYMVVDQDTYAGDSDLLSNSEFPSLSRYAGMNTASTWGALLLGKQGHVEIGAKYAKVFGYRTRAIISGQFVFGSAPSAGIAVGDAQTSRVTFGKLLSGSTTDTYLPLGDGTGEDHFLTEHGKAYYVVFHCMGTTTPGANLEFISWSGSVLAYLDGPSVTLVPGSLNITETGNAGTPDLTFTVIGVGEYIAFVVDNNELTSARFVGFADFVEVPWFPVS